MKIEANKVVVLSYVLTVDGQVVDQSPEGQPLDYIHGTHMLLPKFEAEIEGLEEGASYSFSASPEEGYGEYDPLGRFDIPKSSFSVKGELREDLLVIGNVIPMLNSQGQVCHAQIIEVKDDAVTVDFNHPMAGKTLNFTGKIISVRDATEKELKEGLHGEFLPPEEHHCCHGKGGCGKHKGEGHCHHHGEGEGCCHHGEGEGEGCCHHGEGEGCCHES